MKHISIIIPKGASIIDTLIAPYNLLMMANTYHKRRTGSNDVLYKVDLVSENLEPITYQGLFTIQATNTFEGIKKTDLIILGAISGDLVKSIEQNIHIVEWIKKQRIEHNAEIASLCKGAFLLAETGLLNGKQCSTHWTSQNLFIQRYPKVKLAPEKIISEDNGIYSSGGAYSFLNFMLYMIEKYYDRETAIEVSKISEIDIDRIEQSQFMVFNGQKDHQDEAVLEAQEFIERNYQQKINIEEIAKRVNVSGRNFIRRFKKATANTPLEYVQRVKIEAAKKLIESSTLHIQEVMFDVGYNDDQAFRKVFKKFTGLSPLAYRNKYNPEMANIS